MRFKQFKSIVIFVTTLTCFYFNAFAQRPMEFLDRSLVVQERNGGGTFLTWRMLGTDPRDVAFNIYRDGTKVNSTPITSATNYTDNQGNIGSQYQIETIKEDGENEMTEKTHLFPLSTDAGRDRIPIKCIPLDPPVMDGIDFYPGNMSTGDLNGDGQYELVVKWYPNNAKDNSQGGVTGNTYLAAHKLDGTFL